jgi:hypothetical protein
MINLTRPTGLSLQQWADAVALDAPGVPRLDTADWQDWAARLLLLPEFGALPSPYDTADWQDWAARACEVLS